MAKYTLSGKRIPRKQSSPPVKEMQADLPLPLSKKPKVTMVFREGGVGPVRPVYGEKYGKIGPPTPDGYYGTKKVSKKKK